MVITEELRTWLLTRAFPMPAGLEGWTLHYMEVSPCVLRVQAVSPEGATVERTGTDRELIEFQVIADALELNARITKPRTKQVSGGNGGQRR